MNYIYCPRNSRLRGGQPKETLDTSDAIFVTHNKSLQDVAHRFFKEYFDRESLKNIVQLCMTDTVFSSRLWVKTPTAVNWRPRNQVIAFALSNLAPTKGVRDSFLARLRDLVASEKINAETATFVEFSQFTNELLALDYRHGDVINESEAEIVIQRVIAKTKSDLLAARSRGLEQGVKQTEIRYRETVKSIEAQGRALSEVSQRDISALRQEIDRTNTELAAFEAISARIASLIVGCVMWVVCFGAVAAILMAIGAVPNTRILIALSGVSSLLLTWMTWLGLSGRGIFVTCREWAQARLLRWAAPTQADPSKP